MEAAQLRGVRHVCFGGGGMVGRRYGGVLRALRHYCDAHPAAAGVASYEEWFRALAGAAGTSAGSIVALMLVLDLPPDAVDRMILQTAERSSFLRHPDLGLAWSHFGVDSGAGARDLIAAVLAEGGLSPKVAMADLARYTGKDLVVVATDLTSRCAFRISAATAPRMLVLDAIYASCAIPLIYTPHTHEGRLLVDGCVVENRPRCFPPGERCLEVAVRGPCSGAAPPPDGLFGFVASVVDAAVGVQESFADELERATGPVGRPPVRLFASWPGEETECLFSFEDTPEPALRASLAAGFRVALDGLFGGALARAAGGAAVGLVAHALR